MVIKVPPIEDTSVFSHLSSDCLGYGEWGHPNKAIQFDFVLSYVQACIQTTIIVSNYRTMFWSCGHFLTS